ncbi:MAG TPA: hypothetical protein VOA00_01355 [Thermoanaerobaculia bacterium]|nr:hypothetical protein [Thermoanaerobaculia bacterium]
MPFLAAAATLAAPALRTPTPMASPAAPPPSTPRAISLPRGTPGVSRRLAIRAAAPLTAGEEIDRLRGWALRQGLHIEAAGEDAPVPSGWEVLRIAIVPVSPSAARKLDRFGVHADASGFTFDGRAYRGADDAIAMRDPKNPAETFVLGTHPEAALRLAARRVFRRDSEDPDYRVVSGELAKYGRFTASGNRLEVDRKADRDEISAQAEFLRSLAPLERGGVRWQFAERDRSALARFEPVIARFLPKVGAARVEVRLFPEPVTKARLTGSSRPAEVAVKDGAVRVEIDASAPLEPDLVSPALAAAAYAARDARLAARPTLLLALGARAVGKWWGREVSGFAGFARRAGVSVTASEAMAAADEPPSVRRAGSLDSSDAVSPVLAVGCAASWLEAGVRAEGEPAVLRLVGGPEALLAQALRRWEAESSAGAAAPVGRRPLPAGFLRGVSYAMSNSIDAGYASPRSAETLRRLAGIGTNSISVMPFAFERQADRPTLSFVHRSPRGETDEGTVRAVENARSLGMTAMVKPQIWVGDDVFVGKIAMRSEEDWKRWFELYRRFVVHHAIVAEAAGAGLYCVGTELAATELRVADWRETIAAVRLATGAPLTYAANWAGGAVRVPFWNDLDAIGVDFYDPPSGDPEASDAALETGVRAAARPLAVLSQRTGKPVVFTEAGFPLARAAWISPHDENSGRPASAADSARAIAAVFRALEKEPWWKGVYWWKAFSSGREARPDERGFNVLGGATERAVADGFARLAPEGGR